MSTPAPDTVAKKPRRQRGKASAERKQEARKRKFVQGIREQRELETNRRCADAHNGPGRYRVTPFLGARQTRYTTYTDEINPRAILFYAIHPGVHEFLEVRSGVSVANPLGTNKQRSLWTTKFIEGGKTLCPYLGRMVRSGDGSREYSLRLDSEMHIDASQVDYDVGYLAHLPRGIRQAVSCPPNYGKYCNTIDHNNPAQRHLQYNVYFEPDVEGYWDVWLKSLCDIPAGTELLVDYGSEFHL